MYVCVYLYRRNFVFSIVQSAVSASPHLSREEKKFLPPFLQDLPWTMLRFAAITRSAHELRDISLALLIKLQHLPAFNQPAYAQEHLQALVYMNVFLFILILFLFIYLNIFYLYIYVYFSSHFYYN